MNPYEPPSVPVETVPLRSGEATTDVRRLPRWLKRTLLLFTLGGGFAGLALTVQLTSPAAVQNGNFLVLLVFALVFGFGIYAGWRLSEDELAGIGLSKLFLAMQVPSFSSPLFGVSFMGISSANIGLNGNGVVVGYRFGSEAWLSIAQGAPWGVSVNIVALALLILCIKAQEKMRTIAP